MANFLAEYECLPPELIVKIFNNKFIENLRDYNNLQNVNQVNLDKNILNLMRNLANLNQMVCLTYPQYNIPWFNENNKRKEFLNREM